jgi:initiation factor 1A
MDLVEYAQVVKMLGNGRLEAKCFDGQTRLAHIRGKLRKKVWINQGDIILLYVNPSISPRKDTNNSIDHFENTKTARVTYS